MPLVIIVMSSWVSFWLVCTHHFLLKKSHLTIIYQNHHKFHQNCHHQYHHSHHQYQHNCHQYHHNFINTPGLANINTTAKIICCQIKTEMGQETPARTGLGSTTVSKTNWSNICPCNVLVHSYSFPIQNFCLLLRRQTDKIYLRNNCIILKSTMAQY